MTKYAFEGCYDRSREALEEREATPEEGYLLEKQGREIATLGKRLANAELLIEKLKEDVGHWEEDFAMFDRAHKKAINLWRKEHPDAGYTPDMSDLNEWMVRRVEKYKEAAPFLTRQTLRMAIDDMKQTLKDSHHVSKEWADMIRQVIRLWEKKLGEVEE